MKKEGLRQRHVRVERVGATDPDRVAGIDRDVHVKFMYARVRRWEGRRRGRWRWIR